MTPISPTSSRSAQPRSQRLVELDGVRGLAAVIVLIHHSLLTVPALGEVGARPGVIPTSTAARLLTTTPLHLLWMGHEAVLIFFVLSGVALVYPIARRDARGDSFDWVDYFPRRVVRLWVPAVAATVWATITMHVIHRSTDPSLGPWTVARSLHGWPTAHLLPELLLIPSHAYRNSVLWSLHAEAIFSFLLPIGVLLVALVARWRLRWLPVVLALAVPLVTGSPGWASYMPVFAIGATLGWYWGHLEGVQAATPRRWSTPLAVLLLVTMTADWWPFMMGGWRGRVADTVVLASAAGIVVLTVRFGAARRLMRSRVVQWLGLMSYSLYLIHEPVVLSVRNLTSAIPAWWTLPITAVIALPLAWAFHKVIEAPSHRLSRRTGRAVSTWYHGRRSTAR